MTDASPALFDRLADRFDQVIPFFATFAEQLLDVLAPAPGTRVLDVGCGRGAIALAAAARGCEVTAVDAAPRMVALLAEEHPELDVREMDAHELDLPDKSYDLVTGGFVAHLVNDRSRMMAELRRVLRPGGRVALTVPGPCAHEDRRDGWNRLVREFSAREPERLPPRDLDIEPYLRAAGFVALSEYNLEVHLPVADPRTCWDFHMSHGFSRLMYALNPTDAAEFEQLALAELARMHHAGGIIVDRGATVYAAAVPEE